jgi:hypothetical protein
MVKWTSIGSKHLLETKGIECTYSKVLRIRVTHTMIPRLITSWSKNHLRYKTKPKLMDPKDLAAHELKDVKSRRIILDVVKDHLIPHISEKKSVREMFVAMTNHFQSNNTNRKMVLREKVKDTKMTRLDTMTCYLTKITQVHDQLATVGEVTLDEELVRMALNGFLNHRPHSSKALLHGRNFLILIDHGTISSRRRFRRNL